MTNLVIFNPRPQRVFPWNLGGQPVAPATSYKYLGLIFDGRKGLKAAQGRLVDSGRKALFGMMGICSQQDINDPSLRQHMWNALILPVLSYGAELWGGLCPTFTSENYFAKTPGEKVHRTFLRWLTGAGRTTHSRVLPQAAGQLPLGAHWASSTASFWNRLADMDSDRLAHLAFHYNIELMHKGGECWASRAVGQFKCLGMLSEAAVNSPQVPLWDCRLEATGAIARSNRDFWAFYQRHSPRSLPTHHVDNRTLHTFSGWFHQLADGLPVHHNVPAHHWRRVIKFSTGNHPLQSCMAARHTTAAKATCLCCDQGKIEDELHFLLECPAYSGLREEHAALFAGAGPGTRGLHHIFQRANFGAISAYLRASLSHRVTALEAHELLVAALAS